MSMKDRQKEKEWIKARGRANDKGNQITLRVSQQQGE